MCDRCFPSCAASSRNRDSHPATRPFFELLEVGRLVIGNADFELALAVDPEGVREVIDSNTEDLGRSRQLLRVQSAACRSRWRTASGSR